MANYISSNSNRFYAAVESAYGQAGSVTSSNRFPAVRLAVQQGLEQGKRHDKTGSRTFLGVPANTRRLTAVEVRTYLTSWSTPGQGSYGPLFQAALGATPSFNSGITVAASITSTTIQTANPHGLATGSGVSYGNDIRFVTAVNDATTFTINAPFTAVPSAGALLAPTVTYKLASKLPSLTLYDYWDPATAVQRAAVGVGISQFAISINGDFHEFLFRGPAADVVDSKTLITGTAGLNVFPAEPLVEAFDYSIVPGHVGSAWIGTSGARMLTLTEASIQLNNSLETRNHEFGALLPQALVPGPRQVNTHFSVLAQDSSDTVALYQAARERLAIPALLQLGIQQGQLMAIYLPKVVPELPHYNDDSARLQWSFTDCLAQGGVDDELFIAFA